MSVVIPTFNRAHLIARAIDSVLTQSYPQIEIVVADDGSIDATRSVLQGYGDRVRYFHQANAGVAAARNLGIANARGEFIAFLDSDDAWRPWKIQAQMAGFQIRPEVGLVWTDITAIDRSGGVKRQRYLREMYSAYRSLEIDSVLPPVCTLADLLPSAPPDFGDAPVRIGDIGRQILMGNLVHTSTVLLRRAWIEQAGGLDPRWGSAGEDYEYYTRVCALGPVMLIDAASILYQVDAEDQMTAPGKMLAIARSDLRTIRARFADPERRASLPPDVARKRLARALGWVGSEEFEVGHRLEAARHLAASLRVHPALDRRALLFALCALPRGALDSLRTLRRRLREGPVELPVRADQSLSVRGITGLGPAREEAERALENHGIRLPFPQRACWQEADGATGALLLVVEGAEAIPVGAVGVRVLRSRALPLHRIYRIERLKATSPAVDSAWLTALARTARKDPFSLTVVIEVFEPDERLRGHLRERLVALGFARTSRPRIYERTLALELRGTEEELFKGLSSSARRNVRAPGKRGLVLRPIMDPGFVPRIEQLMSQAFGRTNAAASLLPWERIIEISTLNPSLSRLVGLFHPETRGRDSLLSFAWGCAHGTYATYEAGAAIRRPDLGTLPLSYAPLWELIAWARRETTASWFDLGGVPTDTANGSTAGIAKFKEYFSETLVDAGEEWRLETHRVRNKIAGALSTAKRWTMQAAAGLKRR